MRRVIAALAALAAALVAAPAAAELVLDKPPGTVRIATFDASLVRRGAGVLAGDISGHEPQVMAVAEILLRVRPDVVLINEFDWDPQGEALDRFARLLRAGLPGLPGIDYAHRFAGQPNSGVPTRTDIDRDGRMMGRGDALGYGSFPGQYGMALLSRFPLERPRTFRKFPWSKLPGAEAPRGPDGRLYWLDSVWKALPLSSKSHWDVPVELPGATVHLLASHPTPPVFDGPEDRNGLRNAAEIGFWTAYLDGAVVLDDSGRTAPLPRDATVVVLGCLNLDPEDGDGRREAIRALLAHPRLQDPKPASEGGRLAARQGGDNRRHDGDPALDTTDWDEPSPGNMRVDFVLPSADLDVAGAGVFWPPPDDPLAHLVAVDGRERASSDHRLVWVDIRLP